MWSSLYVKMFFKTNNIEAGEMSRWNFKRKTIFLIFGYRVFFLHCIENTGNYPQIHFCLHRLIFHDKCITFPQRLGAEARYPPHNRKPEVLSLFCPENFIVSTQQTRYGGERGRYKPRDRQTGVVSLNFPTVAFKMYLLLRFSKSCVVFHWLKKCPCSRQLNSSEFGSCRVLFHCQLSKCFVCDISVVFYCGRKTGQCPVLVFLT